MSSKNLFAGVHAVLYALFREDESLDVFAMARQVDYCVKQGCHGITLLGLATEVHKLTFDERKLLIEQVSRANKARLPFSVTVPGNSVAEQVELAKFAQQNGADWLILQPPMVGSYGADVYLDFFERVANSIDLPVAVQNAPQYLGRALSGEDIARLRERCSNFVCVKSEDAALGVQRIISLSTGEMHILGGRGALEMTDCLRAGCEGFVLAPDIAPAAVRIFNAWQSGDRELAEHLYSQALPAVTFVMQSLEHLITYGKRIHGALAGEEIHDRAPCLATNDFGLETAGRWATHLAKITQTNNK